MKRYVRRLTRAAGWTVHRWPTNRFDGMADALTLLRRNGYAPRVIVDIGANVGLWTELAMSCFDAAEYHLVEPQAACHDALARFRPPRCIVHKVALTTDGVSAVTMVGGRGGGGTGFSIAPDGVASDDAETCPATSLDDLLGDRFAPGDAALLKLDVEGHELAVLGASTRVLGVAEIVILEFQLFAIDGNALPTFADVIGFMGERGFILYDIAALAARPRDSRLRMGDAVFVRGDSALALDTRWD